jgi:hypothetical protein
VKKYWIVSNAEGGALVKHTTEKAAEDYARQSAETRPGEKYLVFALVSSFVISAMVEERAQ